MMRATWSTEPPGGNTATNLIGCLVGQACAIAKDDTLSAANVKVQPSAALNVRRCMVWVLQKYLSRAELLGKPGFESLRLLRIG